MLRHFHGFYSFSSPQYFSLRIPHTFFLWLLLALTSVSPLSTAWAQAPTAAPTLSAIPGNTQVSLSWEAIAGATSYRVYQSTSEGTLGTNVTTPGTTHASITGLTNGTIYYFTVAARNTSGDGPNSAQVAVTPILFPVLSPAVLGDNSVTLNWTAVPGASYYEVYRALVSASFGTTPLATTTATTFTDSTAVNTTAYQYRVRAANPTPNTYLTSVTRTATPMAAPVVSVVPGSSQVSLTWNEIAGSYPVPGSGAYHVYRSTVAGELGTLASARNTPDSSVTSLTNGTTYYFSVQARNVTGGGPFSAQVACTPVPAPALNAPILGDNLVSLEWSSVIGASYYEVHRALVGDSFGATPLATTTATTWADASASNGTAYQYKIRAANPDPNPNLTSAVKNATPMAAPVLSAVPGYRQVSLSWGAITGATSYRVYQSTVAGELGTVVVSPTVTNASRTGLTVGTTYYYTVQARNATGSGPLSQQISVLSVQPAVVSIAGIGDGSVSLAWTAVTGATYYEIYRGPDTASFGTTPLSTTTSLSYTDTTATNGTAFYYKVRAANPDPNPNLDSNVVTAKSMAAPVVTAVPGVAQVALSWSAASGATGYRVYQSSVNGELGTLVQTTAGLTSSRTSLTNGTTYYFTVIPYNSTNNGPASVQVSAKPLALPVAVNPVTITPGDSQIGLSFPSVANASEYRIYRATTSNSYDYGTPTLTATGSGTVTALDTGLTNGTTYYYVVRSVNTSGVSASSTQVSATTLARPVAPTLSGTAGDGEVELDWAAVSTATSYIVKRSTTTGGPYATIAPSLTTTNYTDTSAFNGTTYYYIVTAGNASGQGSPSNEVAATPTGPPTGPPGDQPDFGTTRSLLEVLDNREGMPWSAVHLLASQQATVTLGPKHRNIPEAVPFYAAFEGTFTPASNDTRLAIFSDDGCDVFIDGVLVHNHMGVGQHLPALAQSLHQIDEELESGHTYTIRVEYFNGWFTGATDADGATLFAYTYDENQNRPLVEWRSGNAISCGGIRWPYAGATISPGAEGNLSAFLATDFDQRDATIESVLSTGVYSDPCSYTWSATGGSFKNGVTQGQGVVWIAPATPGTYTIRLVVDDQNMANQPTYEPGARNDLARGYNDEPLIFSATINVAP